MPRLALLAALGLAAAGAPAQPAPAQPAPPDPAWLRYPAISPDGQTIAFTWKGDLYRVPAAGGQAVPLTAHTGHDFMPVWSRDGRRIAFASERHGNFDVWIIGATGGAATRLTFHSAHEYPYAFGADDRTVLFGATRMDAATNRQYPSGAQPELWEVPADGGRPMQLLTTPAEQARPSRDGRLIVYEDRKGGENAWRKHHVSAVARDLWIHDRRTGEHRQLTTFAGEDRNPVLSPDGRDVYYLSEASGTFNVHRMPASGAAGGGDGEQLTRFTGAPVRFLSMADDGTLAFGHDGQLYTMRPGGQPARVRVAIASDAKTNVERVMPVTKDVRELAVAPSGKEVAFTFRGDVFVASVEGGVTKRITRTPEIETGVGFSPDGRALVYASEREGRWAIYEARRARESEPYFFASTVVRERPLVQNDRQNTEPRWSPDGRELAYTEDRNTLKVLDVASGQARTLLTDRHLFGSQHHVAWSPDGKWLLFDLDVPGIAPPEVGLVRADGKGEVRNLTESGFADARGKWIMNGRAMLWFSNRDGLRSVAQTGSTQQDVYAMFFDRDAWDRFRLTREELALVKEAEEKEAKTRADSAKAKADSIRKAAPPRVLDLDGVENRKARLTIHSATLGDALLSKDGETLYYLARFEKGMNLWSTQLRTKETKMVLALGADRASMDWDREQKTIFVLADGAIAKIDPATGKRESVNLSGEMTLDIEAERLAQFDHVWRRTRDTYYTAGYHGADWPALRAMYARHLPGVSNGWEFSELLAEMLGELNVSHSGASFNTSQPTDDATASLGVIWDHAHRGAGFRVAEVLKGGPLDRPAIDVNAGTIVASVDGEAIGPDRDIAELLNRKTGKNVLLGLVEDGKAREVVVKPIAIAEENRLLYTRWVRRNAEEVDRVSEGRLGYVHIPGMNDGAYRTTFEEVMGKYATREGVVVDTRFNGGGDLVADLAMFLSGKKFFDYTTDTRSGGYEPNFRWTKPSVSLVNEGNYSDGHCYAHAYKEQRIGPLIGMPVPGTCTFAGWESLGEGLRWGVPGLGVKDVTTGKYLENVQTEPDIRVRNDYDVVAKGRDQQLEAAVKELMKLVKVVM